MVSTSLAVTVTTVTRVTRVCLAEADGRPPDGAAPVHDEPRGGGRGEAGARAAAAVLRARAAQHVARPPRARQAAGQLAEEGEGAAARAGAGGSGTPASPGLVASPAAAAVCAPRAERLHQPPLYPEAEQPPQPLARRALPQQRGVDGGAAALDVPHVLAGLDHEAGHAPPAALAEPREAVDLVAHHAAGQGRPPRRGEAGPRRGGEAAAAEAGVAVAVARRGYAQQGVVVAAGVVVAVHDAGARVHVGQLRHVARVRVACWQRWRGRGRCWGRGRLCGGGGGLVVDEVGAGRGGAAGAGAGHAGARLEVGEEGRGVEGAIGGTRGKQAGEERLRLYVQPDEKGADFRRVILQRLLGSVSVLPDLDEDHAGVEPVEDEEGEGDPGDDAPGQQPEELGLHALGDVAVRHEGVEHPQRDVGEQHEGDDLPPGLGLLLGAGRADTPAGLADDHTCGENI